MELRDTDGRPPAELLDELGRGGRFVRFPFCASFLVVTLVRSSPAFFLPPGRWAGPRGLPFAAVSLVCGWWGLPWGLLATPVALAVCLTGGEDVTDQACDRLRRAVREGGAA